MLQKCFECFSFILVCVSDICKSSSIETRGVQGCAQFFRLCKICNQVFGRNNTLKLLQFNDECILFMRF